MPKVSIIVPVYKAEKYINRCIDSILAQTYTDWELLLVDDGSPDRSGEICDEYAKKDSRIRVFHKENGGVSSARNLGLDNVCGEYVAFVDSDDWIVSDAMCSILCEVEKNNVDVCFFALNPISEKDVPAPFSFSNICGNSQFRCFRGMQNVANVIPEIELCGGMGWTCNKIFKRSIVERNHIRFDMRFSIQEDHLFTLKYMLDVNSLLITNAAPYNYVILDNSLTSREQFYSNSKERNKAMLESRNKLCKRFKINNNMYIAWFMSDYATRSVSNLTRLKSSELTYKERIREIDEINSFISNHSVKIKGRAAYYRYIKWIPSQLLIMLL